MAIDDTPLVPIEFLGREFHIWLKDQIYTGVAGSTGRYVPNIGDAVWDWATGLWRVVDVDRTTGLSTLAAYVPPKDPGTVDPTDILLGAGPGYQSESFRVFLDTSVMPHTLAVDARLYFYGTTVSYIKVFLGGDYGDDGTVISAMYDQNGTLLGENIPLEVVAQVNPIIGTNPLTPMSTSTLGVDNYAVKTPMVGYTLEAMPDNQVVTIVAYDDANSARSIAKCLVQNSSFIRTTDASKRYITHVALESPFMSDTDNTLLKFPINLATSALDAHGMVYYSNGEPERMPIDGVKFQLHGLDNYVASIVGQKIPLVLTYNLSMDEFVYGASMGANRHLSVPYNATTTRLDGGFTPKLFCLPVWVDAVNGYRLEWYMYNLDRELVTNVTSLVRVDPNRKLFDPTEYGTTQNLTVDLDMSKVDSRFSAWRHVQTLGVTLLNRGDLNDTNWLITYTPGVEEPFGLGLKAKTTFVNTNLTQVDLSSGQTTQEAWLRKVYYNAEPLYDAATETGPLAPNYFVLTMGASRVEYPIDQWNTIFETGVSLREGSLVYLEFKKRTTTTDLQLAISGLTVHQTTSTTV